MAPDLIKDYFDLILRERNWSWSLIGIVYMIAALIVRSLFLSPMVRKAKELNRTPYEELKKAYLKRAPLGWVFFLFSFLLMIGVWNRATSFPLNIKEALAILGIFVTYAFSIVYHLQALGVGAIIALKRVSEKEVNL